MEILCSKREDGAFIPFGEEASEASRRFKPGQQVWLSIRIARNYRFLSKFMKMLRTAFDAWEPAEQEYQGLPVEKNFEDFREKVTIAAGFSEMRADPFGGVIVRAKSISFERMKEEEFEKVYKAVSEVVLNWVLTNYTRDDLDRVVNELESFL